MQITVEIKNVYGVERIYAVCNNAKLITKLKNSKTLSKEDISILKELGYTIQTKQQTNDTTSASLVVSYIESSCEKHNKTIKTS